MPHTPSTFTEVLSRMLRHEPGRPLVTFYDEGTGERTELSVTTYANWVAKTANLLVEDHDVGVGDRLLVDLPPHWLAPVFLGAAWTTGAVVSDRVVDATTVVCGPGRVEHWAARPRQALVIACSLHPMATRFTTSLPEDVVDFGVEVWSQPDGYLEAEPYPTADDAALDMGGTSTTHGELWRQAAAGSALTDGGRLLSTANPASPPGIAAVSEAFSMNGSLVLVTGAGPDRLAAIAAAERVTARA